MNVRECIKTMREANRKGERIARWGDGAREGERGSHFRSRERDVEKGQLRD